MADTANARRVQRLARVAWAMCGAGLAALLATCGAAQAKVVRVPMIAASAAPKIDGVLDEPIWRSAGIAGDFLLEETGAIPSQPTTVYLLCDGKRLFVGVRGAESDPAGMRLKATQKEGGVWFDDFVEIHIDVTNGKRRFEQFAVTPAGVKTDDAMGKHARVAATRAEGEWHIEMALDLADLGVRYLGAPVRWALNIGRVRHTGGAAEETSVWNGAPRRVDDAAVMGEMIVGPEGALTIDGLEVEDARWGSGNALALRMTNAGAPRPVTVSAKPVTAEKDEREERASTVVATGQGQARGTYAITSLDAEQPVGITLADASGPVLYRLVRAVELPPLLSLQPLLPRSRGLILPDMDKCGFLAELGLTERALAGVTLQTQVYAAPWSNPTRLVSRLGSEQKQSLQAASAGREPPPGSEILYEDFTPRTEHALLSVPTAPLPYGDLAIRVRLATMSDRGLAEVSMPLRRLTEKEAAALPSYVDEHNRLIVDGKPFFPLGWYCNGNVGYLNEVADSPFNCLLDYGINGRPLDKIREYLDAAHACGIKLIYCMNDLYPAATYHKQLGPWTGNQDMARGVISTFKDHPAVLAWYLNDELPVEMIPDLMRYYDLVRSTDPGHPTFIVHFAPDIIPDFVPTTDVLGIDVYPVPTRPLTRVSEMTDVGMRATRGLKPLWMVLQAFAWYQYSPPEDPKTTGGRGRIPTANELRTGRAPTREEERCMTYLALTHGAMGLIYYSYYDLRVLPQYQEMWGWMKQIGAEVRELSPVLLSPTKLPVEVRGDSHKIHAVLKEHEGKWYLLAVNGETTPAKAQFTLPGAAASVRVMFEEHTPSLAGRTLTDEFAPYAAHVYEITPAAQK
jgi:hypothetical protein